MEDKKENKAIFDDKNYNHEYQQMLVRSREHRKLDDTFLNKLNLRVINGIASFEETINTLPEEYKQKFTEIYENSTK